MLQTYHLSGSIVHSMPLSTRGWIDCMSLIDLCQPRRDHNVPFLWYDTMIVLVFVNHDFPIVGQVNLSTNSTPSNKPSITSRDMTDNSTGRICGATKIDGQVCHCPQNDTNMTPNVGYKTIQGHVHIDLLRYELLGIVKRIPFDEPVEWWYRMMVTRKHNDHQGEASTCHRWLSIAKTRPTTPNPQFRCISRNT